MSLFTDAMSYLSTAHPSQHGHFTVRVSQLGATAQSALIAEFNRQASGPMVDLTLVSSNRSGTLTLDIVLDSEVVGLIIITMLSPDIEVFPYEITSPTPAIANLDIEIEAMFVMPAFFRSGLAQYLPYELSRFIKHLISRNVQNGSLNLVSPAPGVGVLIGVYAMPNTHTGIAIYQRIVKGVAGDRAWLNSLLEFNVHASVTSYLMLAPRVING